MQSPSSRAELSCKEMSTIRGWTPVFKEGGRNFKTHGPLTISSHPIMANGRAWRIDSSGRCLRLRLHVGLIRRADCDHSQDKNLFDSNCQIR
jgi:hypothetical protein